ncbi:UNVERIFIED_CONTAM: hypothetical protein FKN15_068930 [Acipenser sinensis]
MGLCRMVPEFVFGTGSCLFPSSCPPLICGVHYLYFAVLLFCCTAALVVAVSYCTPPIADRHLHRLVFSLRHSTEARDDLDREEEERMRQARRAAAEKSIVGNVLEVQVSLPKPHPVWRCISWFCGMGSSQDPEPSEEEVAEASKQLPDISEDPFWKNVVNTNAIIMMVVAVFLWGYYA